MPDMEKVIKDLKEYRDREFVKEGITIFDSDPRYRKMIINHAIALLKEQEAVRWIPVAEKLPKSIANKVIVYLQHDELVPEIGYGHYEKYKGVEMWYNLETHEQFSKRGYTVTHWMPMPKSPEGEKLVLY